MKAIFYRITGSKPWNEGWILDTQANLIKISDSKYGNGTWWSESDIETKPRKERD